MLRRKATQEIPHALTDVPEYAAAKNKLAELHQRKTDLEQKAGNLHDALRGDSQGANAIITAKAKALIAGRTDEVDRLAQLRGDWEQTQEDLAVIAEAIRLQEGVLEALRVPSNRLVVEAVLPEHKRLAGRIAAALKELKTALSDEQRFRDDLESGGIVGLRNVAFTPAGDASDYDSPIEQWFKEMGQLGYV